jgi:hypothetical protein
MSLDRLVAVFGGQVHDPATLLPAGVFSFAHFFQIVAVFIAKHFATRKAFHWKTHGFLI